MFSTCGLLLNAKRMSMAPFRANIVSVIHDNYPKFFPVTPSGATKGGGGWRGLEHPPEQNWGALQFVQIRRLFLEGGGGGGGGGVARVGHTEWHIGKQFYKL
jgi:hypothetical protein